MFEFALGFALGAYFGTKYELTPLFGRLETFLAEFLKKKNKAVFFSLRK